MLQRLLLQCSLWLLRARPSPAPGPAVRSRYVAVESRLLLSQQLSGLVRASLGQLDKSVGQLPVLAEVASEYALAYQG